jgi:hypothetical protein
MGRRGRDRMVVGFITTSTYGYMLSVPITINVVSSNPAQARCIRYNIM